MAKHKLNIFLLLNLDKYEPDNLHQQHIHSHLKNQQYKTNIDYSKYSFHKAMNNSNKPKKNYKSIVDMKKCISVRKVHSEQYKTSNRYTNYTANMVQYKPNKFLLLNLDKSEQDNLSH